MPKLFSNINNNRDLVDKKYVDRRGIFTVKGTQTASTNEWTGNIDIEELYDGITIAYYLPYAGTSTAATLNLTLSNGNETGEMPVMYTATSEVTTHYGAGSTILLTYWSAGSISVAGTETTTGRWTRADYSYNSDTLAYLVRFNNGYYKAKSVLYRYMILLQKNESELIPLNNVSNGYNKTNKTLTTEEFNPFGLILYYNSTSSVSAGANIRNDYLFHQRILDLRYSFNITTTTFETNEDIYLVAIPQTNGSAILNSTPLTQTLPSTDDGLIYIKLGHMYSGYQLELHSNHPIFWYKDGSIVLYTGQKALFTFSEKTKLNGIEEGAQVNIQSDWNATSGDAFIKNKPTLGTASAKDIGYFATSAQGTKADSAVQNIKMNGTTLTKDTNKLIDLGTVITAHQSLTHLLPKTDGVTNVAYDSTNKKLTKTKNGSTSDIVTLATMKTDMSLNNVNNTSDADKPISTATQTALNNKVDKVANKELMPSALISNNKISTSYLPDYLLGQMIYGGTLSGSTATLTSNAKSKLGTTSATITLTNNNAATTGYTSNEGIYYIATADSTFASLNIKSGDWLVSTGSSWKKIDNTDAVDSVNGKTGAVSLTYTDVGAAASDHKHSATDITSGTLAVARGGTGKTTENDACNAFINALTEGASNATRNDYIVAQYAGGGTTTKTYHRRKLSNLFAALNSSDITTALGFTPANNSHSHDYLDIKNLANDADLNDIKASVTNKAEFYYVGGSNSVTNVPMASGLAFGMISYRNANGYSVQELTDQNGIKYIRYYNNSSWTSWKTFSYTDHTHSTYLPLSGGTMTGMLKAKADQYTDSYTTGGIDMQNSNIINVNSIYTKDASDGAGEGINFYRDSTHVDTFWMAGGHMYFVPNRALGTSTTAANSKEVLHSGLLKVTYTTDLGVDTTDVAAIGYIKNLTKSTWNYQQTDGALYRQVYNASWVHEIFGDYKTGQISVRGRNNGTWQSWRRILDETNYSSIISLNSIGALPSTTNYALSDSVGGSALSVKLTEGTSDSSRYIWFSDSNNIEKACYDNNFKYNPSTNLLNVGNIDSSGYIKSSSIGKDGFILYPGGASYADSGNPTTGFIKITLPVSWNSTMMKFVVSIFEYVSNANSQVDYYISGYNYNGSPSHWVNCSAYCIGKGSYTNLPVKFGHDGSKCAILIGTASTNHYYIKTVVHDFLFGHNSNTFDTYKSGWSVSITTTDLTTISTTIENTNLYSTTNTTYALSSSSASIVLTGSDSSSDSIDLGTNLLPNLPVWSADPTDNVYLIRRDTAGGAAYGQVKFSTVWNYIKSKANSVYAAISHGNHVPATETANNAKFLRNDNTWQTVTPANIGAATSDHTHNITLATDTGASTITLAHNTTYKLTAGGKSVIFKTPTDSNTTYNVFAKTIDGNYKTQFRTQTKGDANNGYFITALRQNTADVDSSPKYAAGLAIGNSDTQGYLMFNYNSDGLYVGGGNADKLNWTSRVYTTNYKPTAADVGAATSGHTHTITLATDSGTSSITLAHGSKYKLTAGGSSVIFTMPTDNNTNYYHTTGSWSGLTYTATANGGAGALAFTIPTGTTATTVAVGNHTHSDLTLINNTGADYTQDTTASKFKVYLTRQKHVDISTLSNGGVLISSQWTSSNYNAELFIGMGDGPGIWYRGNNGNGYIDWLKVLDSGNTSFTRSLTSGTKIGSIKINGTSTDIYCQTNTDTKVTAVGNHYTPAEDTNSQLTANASSTTAATWNSTSLVTGVVVKRDAKGHITGLSVNSIKMPANPNTNTDTLVNQSKSTTSDIRPLLSGYQNYANVSAMNSAMDTAVTNVVYKQADVYVQPSSATIGSKKLKLNEKVTLEYNETTESLDFVFA